MVHTCYIGYKILVVIHLAKHAHFTVVSKTNIHTGDKQFGNDTSGKAFTLLADLETNVYTLVIDLFVAVYVVKDLHKLQTNHCNNSIVTQWNLQ